MKSQNWFTIHSQLYHFAHSRHTSSSDHISWLQIQRSGFDYRRYQTFWEVVGLERGPLSLVSTTEELLGRKRGGSGLENRECGLRDPSHWQCGTLHPQKLALTSPTSGGRSACTVRSRTHATEFRSLDIWNLETHHLHHLAITGNNALKYQYKRWLSFPHAKALTSYFPRIIFFHIFCRLGHSWIR
jgi:hypothetical protein